MGDYVVSYPKKVSLMNDIHLLKGDDLQGDVLYIIVKSSVNDIIKILKKEGFHKLKFCENKKSSQIGNGFTKMLTRTWEMHVRLIKLKNDLIAIHGEIEISRRYVQHMVSARAPLFYELTNLLKKYEIEYKIWHTKLNQYVSHVIEDHKIRLKGYMIPLPWIPTAVIGSFFGLWGLLRILGLIPLWPFY